MSLGRDSVPIAASIDYLLSSRRLSSASAGASEPRCAHALPSVQRTVKPVLLCPRIFSGFMQGRQCQSFQCSSFEFQFICLSSLLTSFLLFCWTEL